LDVQVGDAWDGERAEGFGDNGDAQVGGDQTEDGRKLDGLPGEDEVDVGGVKQCGDMVLIKGIDVRRDGARKTSCTVARLEGLHGGLRETCR
jgi:hypothetical protein